MINKTSKFAYLDTPSFKTIANIQKQNKENENLKNKLKGDKK